MVSIIMPTYNRAYIIQRSIDSVLEQTYQDWELIIVDDGSKDDTETVVKKNKDKRIRYIKYSPNRGANHARNVGLEAAKGEYLTFLDSDAVYVPHKLEVQMDAAQQNGCDIVWGRARFTWMDGRDGIFPNDAADILDNDELLIPMSLKEGLINTSTLFFKRQCYEICGGFDENLRKFQDWDFWWKLLLAQKFKIQFLDDVLAVNYMQDDSISSDSTLLIKGVCALVKKHIVALREYDALHSHFRYLLQRMRKEIGDYDAGALREFLELFEREGLLPYMRDAVDIISTQNALIEKLSRTIERQKHAKQKMEWRFPRENIPPGSKVIIYGAGDVGKSFVKQLTETNYCRVGLWVDKNNMKLGKAIHSPTKIGGCDFDYIVVAISDEQIAREVEIYLRSIGVAQNKIVLI